jgi:hypothetical protein
MEERVNAYRILVGRLEGRRTRRRWVNNIKMELRYDGMVWIGLIWLRIGTIGVLL